MSTNPTILAHSSCPDGFTAAWAAWLRYPQAQFVFVRHGEPYPEGLEGQDIIILDFCYPRQQLLELKDKVKSLLVLDHHVSAMKDCGDLPFCHFDMNKSGAGLSWEHFHPNEPTPWLVEYIQYRDLGFLWTKPESEHPKWCAEILACIDSHEKTFERWSSFVDSQLFQLLRLEGQAILRYQNQLIDRLSNNYQELNINGHKALVVNSPILQSEIGNKLALMEKAELGAVWYQSQDNIRFSLRGTKNKVDVSELAKTFGGGGHRNAAGFSLANTNLKELLNGEVSSTSKV